MGYKDQPKTAVEIEVFLVIQVWHELNILVLSWRF